MSIPILYVVDQTATARVSTTRRVVARQRGKRSSTWRFVSERRAGFSHQFDMPDVPAPEDLEDERRCATPVARATGGTRDVHARPTDRSALIEPYDFFNPEKRAPFQNGWMRARDALPDDLRLHQCVLAYLSDWSLLDTSLMPHGVSYTQQNVQSASLDHAMWFHRPFRADAWLLFVQDSPSASGARGFNRGLIYSRDGALVASVAQEGLIRVHGTTK
jgi:acyl-CoA thioesterase-2